MDDIVRAPRSPSSRAKFTTANTTSSLLCQSTDDLSERCKAFYWRRRQKTDEMTRRAKIERHDDNTDRSRLDTMMDKLRLEMASLMERDLALMEQMMKMNDSIQEIKWQTDFCDDSIACSNVTLAADGDMAPKTLKDSVLFNSAPSLHSTVTSYIPHEISLSPNLTIGHKGSLTSFSSSTTDQIDKGVCGSPEHSADSGFEDFIEVF